MLYNENVIGNLLFSRIKESKKKTVDIRELARIKNDMNVVIVGISDKYKKEIDTVLANVKFIDNNLDFDLELLKNVDIILLNSMSGNYALSYKVECIANKKKIPIRNLMIGGDEVSIGYITETAMYSFTFYY